VAKALSAQQRKFIAHYLLEFNATEAAKQAGYSEDTADVQGSRLLRNVRVLDEVRRRCLLAEKRLELNGDDIRSFHARVMTDPRQECDGGPSHIARIMSARELGKLLGLYTSKIEVRGSITLVDLLAAADQRTVVQQPTVQ